MKSLISVCGMVGAAALAVGACSGDRMPNDFGTGANDAVGSTGTGGDDSGSCDAGDVRECTVHINDNNCFVGEQSCQAGAWGPCVESEGLGQKSLGAPAACTGNPCNPVCQLFDEDPSPDLEAAGSPPPANAAGTTSDVPSSIANACLSDTTTACGGNCDTVPGMCQLDTRCVGGTVCTPWLDSEYDMAAGGLDLTIKVGCVSDEVTVCNRGDTAGGMGKGISVWNPVADLCGSAPCDPGLTTGMSGVAGLINTCTIPSDIAPGTCLPVACPVNGNASVMYHVNGCDEFPATCGGEVDDTNNWGYFQNSISCSCTANTTQSSLQDVTMYMMLDNSISMSSSGIWDPAKTAVQGFITDPGSDTINFAFRMYGDYPAAGCNNSTCNSVACETVTFGGPKLLSDATYESQLTGYIGPAGTIGMTPHSAVLPGMAAWGSAWATANPTDLTVLVYITDGGTLGECSGGYNGGNAAAVVAPIGTLYATDGVPTYAVALPGADLTLLNEIASQGGTTLLDLTGSSDVATDLTLALQDIQGSLLSCTIPIPNAGTVDPVSLTAEFNPTSGPNITLTRVANAGACTGADDEYYLVPDAVNPTDVELCSDTCDTARGDVGSAVEFTGGCAGGYTAQSHVFTYTGDCSGYPSGSSPFWDFLSYDTTMVGDATVAWAISTSNVDEATAATGPWTTVATSTFASPDALPSSPVDLRAALSVAEAQAPHVALRITVNPTSSGADTPLVLDWDLQYSCEYNE